MSYFYLMVDRLDEKTVFPAYFPLGTDPNLLNERVGILLESYRKKGFQVVHFSHRPSYKTAKRADGVALEIIVVKREVPLQLGSFNLGFDRDSDDAAAH